MPLTLAAPAIHIPAEHGQTANDILLVRAEASNDGCQLDIMFMTELVADEMVRACRHNYRC